METMRRFAPILLEVEARVSGRLAGERVDGFSFDTDAGLND